MIASIPNQPIDFIGSSLLVDCPDVRVPLTMSLEDVLRFQVGIVPPTGPYAYGDALRDWDVIHEWAGPGSWQYSATAVCANFADAGGYIQPLWDIFNPDLGGVYLVELDIQSITGTSTFSMGDQTVTISAPGVQSFTVIAASTEGPRITLDNDDSRICVSGVTLYKFFEGTEGCETLVELVNVEDDAVMYSFTSATEPQQFTVGGGVIGVSTPLFNVPVGACIYVRITHDCENDDNTLCSQPIKVDGDCQGTVLVRACLDHDAMGFAAPAIFEVRLKASLVRPRWELDSGEERWSDGTINRYYVDRQRVSDLMIQPVDEVLHPFLAALCMFDHVYINGAEYSVDATGYDPTYGDQTGTAAVQLTVRPKRELMRRVTCDEPGLGCAPSSDPQCVDPSVRIVLTYDSDESGRMLRVTVYSAIGFLPEGLTVYVDGVEYAADVWVTPTDFIYGPIPLEVPIQVRISNRIEPSCDWVWDCAAPVLDVEQVIIGGQIYLQVDLRSLTGYVFNSLYTIVNGVQGDPTSYPTSYPALLGPYTEGDLVVVVVGDSAGTGCNYMAGPITIGESPAFSAGGLNGEVTDLRVSDGGLVIGGAFTLFAATLANRLTKLTLDGLLDAAFNTNMGSGFNNAVSRFAIDDAGFIVVVGAFDVIDGHAYSRIARVNPGGLVDLTFAIGTGFNSSLASGIAIIPSGTYIVTGNFTTYNGTSAPSIVGLLPSGAIDTTFNYGTGFNSITGFVIYDPFTDTLLVSGNAFTTYNGTLVRYGTATIVRLNLDGTLNSIVATHVDGTDPQFNGGIRGMSVMADGRIVVTGNFTIYDGTAVGHIAVLNPDGTLDAAYMAAMGAAFSNWTTRSKVQANGKVMVGVYNATTTDFDGNDANGMVRLELDGTRDLTFNTGDGFDGRTGPSDEYFTNSYVGGHFNQLNLTARSKVARLPFP